MNVDGAFILAETRRKTSVLLFIDSRFINDSDEFGKMFVAHIALAHAFKKTNTNFTEQLTSNCVSHRQHQWTMSSACFVAAHISE